MADRPLARVVMVGTTHPGNLGAAARAMQVMGLSALLLARPEADPGDAEAIARASGAGSILADSASFPDLESALGTAQRAYAFTARRRGMGHRLLSAREACIEAEAWMRDGVQVAMVFGPEKSGLTNEEIRLCDAIVEIPTASAKSSLNVAAAVQLCVYELLMARTGGAPLEEAREPELASKEEIGMLVDHTESLVRELCLPRNQGLLEKMLGRLRLLLNRAEPSKADVKMLRGLLSGLGEAAGRGGGRRET